MLLCVTLCCVCMQVRFFLKPALTDIAGKIVYCMTLGDMVVQ